MEARLLRLLFNVWVDEKDRMGTIDDYAAKAEKRDRARVKAEMMLARQRAQEGV